VATEKIAPAGAIPPLSLLYNFFLFFSTYKKYHVYGTDSDYHYISVKNVELTMTTSLQQ